MKDYFKFLWNLEILQTEKMKIIEAYYKFLGTIYLIDVEKYTEIFGLDKILNFIIDELE
jgi:hypothetical protein